MSSRRVALMLTLLAALGGLQSIARAQAPAAPLVDAKLLGGLRYRMVGPSRGGRVTTVTGHRKQPGTFYLGSSGGGVFKTMDYGVTWKPITDGFLDTGSIGAIEVAESNPDVVYVGTGSDGIRSNVIQGKGVYRSNDGGKTWASAGLREVGQISRRPGPSRRIPTWSSSARRASPGRRTRSAASIARPTAARPGRRFST